MQRVPLPNDQWADVRDVADVTVRGRSLVARCGTMMGASMSKMMRVLDLDTQLDEAIAAQDEEAMAALIARIEAADITDDDMERQQRFQYAGVVAFTNRWSYPDPPSMDSVQEMPAEAFDVLQAVCGPLALRLVAKGAGLDVTPDDVEDAASPTAPSDGSAVASQGTTTTGRTTPKQRKPKQKP